jgi:N-acetyl-anhydromuramyl-L-alanine amidase AmpD
MKRSLSYPHLILSTLGALVFVLGGLLANTTFVQAHPLASSGTIDMAFAQASREFQVPQPLLESICYMEGRLSEHSGSPSIDGGYGCMHLVKNRRVDTLDQAAKLLHVNVRQLKINIATNIRGGAAILRQDALRINNHHLPTKLSGWYSTVEVYSDASTPYVAAMYANGVYTIMNRGFRAADDAREPVMLAPQHVTPDKSMGNKATPAATMPQGCSNDGQTDYPGAVDCILPANSFDCSQVKNSSCTYKSANRPNDDAINFVGIHDIEGTAQDALNTFQNVSGGDSIHYIVDSDGTIYQVLHEKDIAYHLGNLWYNDHSIGIEHAGYAATGYQWYNATEYLASAKLVAYLLGKYHIPLDHEHIVGHGTVPAPTPASAPNHVDPGPYWLWDYYLNLIKQQGVSAVSQATSQASQAHTVVLHPTTDQQLNSADGTETTANFNFFNLYTGPSTSSSLVPSGSNGTDVTDETYNVEPDISYYYVTKRSDTAGSGDTMYEIYYGEADQLGRNPKSEFTNGKLAWLAVPPGYATTGRGTLVTLGLKNSRVAKVYGRPTSSKSDVIGDTPNNSRYVSGLTLTEDGTNNRWYEINYNHRQAWVPASEVR